MFSQRLEQLRLKKELTQQQMADILGVTRQAYGNYESGKREPDFSTLTRLANFFGVSVDYLLGKTNVRTPIETIVAHHDGEDWTEEELEEIERFKEFVRMRRQKKENQ
jgi:transcriptional regulator with XRE-family HTH domain